MNKTLLLSVALLTGVAFPAISQEHDHGDDDHEASLGDVSVIHAWTRAASAGGDAVVFFEIENGGEPVVLSGAEAENAATVEIVGADMAADGAVTYLPVGSFTIPVGEFAFDPDGLGIRLNGLTEALEQGEHFHMHLLLDEGELEITVDVEAADATAHSHAGHAH
jgi:periplasmic copper chaperone A